MVCVRHGGHGDVVDKAVIWRCGRLGVDRGVSGGGDWCGIGVVIEDGVGDAACGHCRVVTWQVLQALVTAEPCHGGRGCQLMTWLRWPAAGAIGDGPLWCGSDGGQTVMTWLAATVVSVVCARQRR